MLWSYSWFPSVFPDMYWNSRYYRTLITFISVFPYHYSIVIAHIRPYRALLQITNLMHNSFILQQYVCYITILNMFRAVSCSSSGGQTVLLQPLVSSLSVNSRTVCRFRADCSPLSTCITYGCLQRVTIPEAVVTQFVLLRMSSVLLETCWGS
jgi:hypothetical protein